MQSMQIVPLTSKMVDNDSNHTGGHVCSRGISDATHLGDLKSVQAPKLRSLPPTDI